MQGYFIPFGARNIVSINKKVSMQIKCLEAIGDIEEIDIKIEKRSLFRYALSILPYIDLPWCYEEAYKKIRRPDYIFIRRTGADRVFIKFLRHMKKQYPECKIICEIATYPYIWEMLQDYRGWLFIVKELYNRRYLKKYIDRFVTYSSDSKILGVQTIRTMNGIEVASVRPVKSRALNNGTINMIAVAVMRKAHGYERVIKGMKSYYERGGDRNITFTLVGEGKEKKKYEKLVKRLGLEDKVIFYGEKTGEELDNIYDAADIALSMFGLYKDRIKYISSLKAKEYLAKGLPIVSGCREDIFSVYEFKYFMECPNDASELNISGIVDFYDRIYTKNNKQEVVSYIRQFASEKVDISKTMFPVINYITE